MAGNVKKKTLDQLAIFGGEPLFSSARPIGQLSKPSLEAFLEILRPAYNVGRLDGGGEVVDELEKQLSKFHATKHCVSVANAGLGIIMLIELLAAGRPGNVILPAFSYRGLPHIVRWARQNPRFCDVDAISHTLDLRSVENSIDAETTAILGVCNFNNAGDVAGLCRIGAERNVPVIFDSVEALGATYNGKPLGANGRAEVFSTHATKMLNGFEGGYITTNDDELASILRWQREEARPEANPQFDQTDGVIGLHAEFNEIHAAMSIASLAQLPAEILRNRARAEAYTAGCSGLPGFSLVPFADVNGESSNFRMVVAEVVDGWPFTRDETVVLLRSEGASINAYWSPALHLSVHAPAGAPIPYLPVAEGLGKRLLHLPVGELVSLDDISRLCEFLHFISQSGSEISARLATLAP